MHVILQNTDTPVQVWIYIPAHTEGEGGTVISAHLQHSTSAASHPDLDLQQTEKTNLVLDQKIIAFVTNHSIITAMRQENTLRLIEAPAECNISTLATKGKGRFAKNSADRLGDVQK